MKQKILQYFEGIFDRLALSEERGRRNRDVLGLGRRILRRIRNKPPYVQLGVIRYLIKSGRIEFFCDNFEKFPVLQKNKELQLEIVNKVLNGNYGAMKMVNNIANSFKIKKWKWNIL